MCDGNPMCDYKEMIKEGWDVAQPYIIWPQEAINLIIDGIKTRKNVDITVKLRAGKMAIERREVVNGN
jgi:hypothetical protein